MAKEKKQKGVGIQWRCALRHIASNGCQSLLPLWKALGLLRSPRFRLWVYILHTAEVLWGILKEVNAFWKFLLCTESTLADLGEDECPHRL